MCFMGPGPSSRSAPINMHYNLAQGVHWKGYPITPLKVPLKMSKYLDQYSHTIAEQSTEPSSLSCLKTVALKESGLFFMLSS